MGYCEFGKPLLLFTDASMLAIGAALVQEDRETGLHRVIGYWGRALNKAEKGWAVTHLELLAAARGMLAFSFYLEHNHFTLVTDHSALQIILKKPLKTKKLERLALIVQEFDFDVEHRPGKDMWLPDALSRRHYARISMRSI